MRNPHLEKARKFGLSFDDLDLIAKKAVKVIKKSYSYTGALTAEDLHSTAWLGLLSAISQPRFIPAVNKPAYCYTFAVGYCRHAIHRKSRMIRLPYSVLKKKTTGTAHLSYTWDNLPEPCTESTPEPEFSEEQLRLAAEIPLKDRKRIMMGLEALNPKTHKILSCLNSL